MESFENFLQACKMPVISLEKALDALLGELSKLKKGVYLVS